MFGELTPREKTKAPFIAIEEALEEIRRGRMVILMDDEQRENEGDLCMAAELATTEAAIKMAVRRLRQRYAELLRSEIAHTVSSPDEIEDELRALLGALG